MNTGIIIPTYNEDKQVFDLIKLITVFLKIDLIKNRKKKYEINNNFNNLVNFLKK